MPLSQVTVRSRTFTPSAICGVTDLAIGRAARAIVIGHTKTSGSAEAAAELARQWWAIGGRVIDDVDLSEKNGTLIGAALAFTNVDPDLWIVADTPSNWLRLARELTDTSGWEPRKTLAFASRSDFSDPATVETLLEGLTGVDPTGTQWRVRNGRRVTVRVGD